MSQTDRAEWLKRYRAAPQALREEVAGASMAQLDGPAPDEGWTARQIVHHTADIAIMGALRLRLMLVDVTLEYWDYEQDSLQQVLSYRKRPVGPSLTQIDALVESSAQILDRLRDEQWSIPHRLPTGEAFTVFDLLVANATHIEEHTAQTRYALTGTC